MLKVLDYSWARPDPGLIRSSGYDGVVRYLAVGAANAGKVLTHQELRALWDAGLRVGLVWETTAHRPLDGFNAGVFDCRNAEQQATSLGFPQDVPVFYAVDFETRWENVSHYFDGIRYVASRPIGVYGTYNVVEPAPDWVEYRWQCAAWSYKGVGSGGQVDGYRRSAKAQLFQRNTGVVIPQTDDNVAFVDKWGGYHPDRWEGEDELNQQDRDWLEQKFKEVQHGIATARDAVSWGIVAGMVKLLQELGHEPDTVNVDAVARAVADELANRISE